MTEGLKTRATLAAVIILCCAVSVLARQQGEVAGLIQELKGSILVRTPGSIREAALHPKRDRGRAVYVGESFRCLKGSRLRLRLGGETKVIKGPSPWYTVEMEGSEAVRYKEALKEYVRAGGRSRGDPPPIFSPANYGTALPSAFVIRWSPRPRAKSVTLSIRDAQGGEVWRQESVEGGAGSLTSDDARRALALYRDKGGKGPLTLAWQDEVGGKYQLTFGLLSVKDELAVSAELARWDAEADTLMRHLGRAFVYRVNWLLPQAADEYEAALRAAPESRDLIVRTLLAQFETGNLARAEELQTRLESVERTR